MSNKKLLLTIFAISFSLLMLADDTFACSCLPSHPQSSYCNAEYVIVARILRKSNRKINNHHIYKIDIVKTYKASEKAHQYLKQSRLITAPSDGLCGINFKIGQLYAIAGNSQKVGLCQYIKEYSKMTQVEKRGIAGAYKKGCGCEINLCMNNRGCEAAPSSCEWSLFNECETDFGICVPVRTKMSQQKCQWRRSPLYQSCLLDP
ncbi:hypothetical protein PVAND_002755 [Polypedilum vanderplanki]|uniref:NTR domain-containing protein n=1 Tax=Polypedilum vanderplanki TaxID=319348 RepID=A0A9J6BSC0_POLVA|nr:hypothetical protein PVAND_002755 [Polypedilum vanderplanki]